MWELMSIGIEMQQRMIEVHTKGLALTQEALREAGKTIDTDAAMHEVGLAQEQFMERWVQMWSGRH